MKTGLFERSHLGYIFSTQLQYAVRANESVDKDTSSCYEKLRFCLVQYLKSFVGFQENEKKKKSSL